MCCTVATLSQNSLNLRFKSVFLLFFLHKSGTETRQYVAFHCICSNIEVFCLFFQLLLLYEMNLHNSVGVYYIYAMYTVQQLHSFLCFLPQEQGRTRCVKEFNKFCTPNNSDDLCLLFCINTFSMVLGQLPI